MGPPHDLTMTARISRASGAPRRGVSVVVLCAAWFGSLAVLPGLNIACASEADSDNDWNSNAKKDQEKKDQDKKDQDKKREQDEKDKEKARQKAQKEKEKELERQQEKEKQDREDAEERAKQEEKDRKKKEKDKKNNRVSTDDNPPPSDKNAVVIYYTPGDKNWAAAEKIIDAVNKKYPKLKITKVPNDTPVGRMSLKQIEDVYKIKEHGDITATFESYVLVSQGNQRMVEESFEAVCERILGEAHLKGKLSVDVSAYIKEIFGPQAAVAAGTASTQAADATDYYQIQIDGKTVGWVANGFHHIACPICIDTQFLIALKSPANTVIDLRPVRPLERRGVRLEKPEVDKFMKQFNGRTAQEGAKPVDGISGATTTSTGYVNTVTEILQEVARREKPPAPPAVKGDAPKPDASKTDVKPAPSTPTPTPAPNSPPATNPKPESKSDATQKSDVKPSVKPDAKIETKP